MSIITDKSKALSIPVSAGQIIQPDSQGRATIVNSVSKNQEAIKQVTKDIQKVIEKKHSASASLQNANVVVQAAPSVVRHYGKGIFDDEHKYAERFEYSTNRVYHDITRRLRDHKGDYTFGDDRLMTQTSINAEDGTISNQAMKMQDPRLGTIYAPGTDLNGLSAVRLRTYQGDVTDVDNLYNAADFLDGDQHPITQLFVQSKTIPDAVKKQILATYHKKGVERLHVVDKTRALKHTHEWYERAQKSKPGVVSH